MFLRVEVSSIGDYPPSIIVSDNVPNLVWGAQYIFELNFLHMLDGFVPCLPLNIVCNIALCVRIALKSVTRHLFRGHRLVVNDAIVITPGRFGLGAAVVI